MSEEKNTSPGREPHHPSGTNQGLIASGLPSCVLIISLVHRFLPTQTEQWQLLPMLCLCKLAGYRI